MSDDEKKRLAELRAKYYDPQREMTGGEIEEMYWLLDLERAECVKSSAAE